jgi:phosphoglycerol transferase MdoB-like AlkP superfamily enzyme
MPPPFLARLQASLHHGSTLIQLLAGSVAILLALQFSDDTLCVLINAGLFLLPFLLVAALTGRLNAALAVATVSALLLWGVGEFKLHFFGNRLALLDFYFLSEGANWSIVKRYPKVQAALAAWLLLCLVLGLRARHADRGRTPLRVRGRTLCVLLLAGWCGIAWSNRHQHTWEVFRDDADCGLSKTCGVVSRLLYSYSVFEFMEPLPQADASRFRAAAAELSALPQPDLAQRPDVVVWLNESTLDPAQYRLPGAKLPPLPMFRTSPQTIAAGQLRVHTFGGKTWLSEFSLLTGLVPKDFGSRRSLVFNSVAPMVSSTLVRRYAAAGYDTVVLMPTPKQFYGAARTYEAVGFERILTLRDFPEYDAIKGDEWDIADSTRMAEAAITLLRQQRARSDARPLFLYLLSVKEHAPYSGRTPVSYQLQHSGLKRSMAAKLTDYIDRLRLLDAGIAKLEKALLASPHPALWAYFGDHQAYFEETPPAYRKPHPEPDLVTQYQLRANYRSGLGEQPALLDIALLPSLIVDNSGLPTDPYFAAQTAMRRLCQGRLGDCPDTALVDSYKGHVFGDEIALFEPLTPVVAAQAAP